MLEWENELSQRTKYDIFYLFVHAGLMKCDVQCAKTKTKIEKRTNIEYIMIYYSVIKIQANMRIHAREPT